MVVPVSLNMLPSDGNAVVLSPLSSESAHLGLLQVSIPEYKNPNKMMTMYAIFHIDDVYDEHGKQLIKELISLDFAFKIQKIVFQSWEVIFVQSKIPTLKVTYKKYFLILNIRNLRKESFLTESSTLTVLEYFNYETTWNN